MNKTSSNNYDNLLRYIIVGDMGKNKNYITKLKKLKKQIKFSCWKVMYSPSIYR